MKSFHRLAVIALMLLPLSACGGSDGRESSEAADGEDGARTVMDSARPDSMPPEKELLKFDSPEEAIDYMRQSGHWDEYSRGIIPSVAEECLEYATGLLNNEYSRFIVVDKGRMEVILYNKYGRVERQYGMACAKNFGTKHRRADSRTPEGFFTAEGIYDSTDWLFTDDNGKTSDKKGQFGPRFIRLKCPNTSQIGIHGTVAPWSIGHRVSHGCIRITNENILELVELVEVGMPIIVSPGTRDMKVNLSEGYDIPSITTVPGRSRIMLREEKEEAADREIHADSIAHHHPEPEHADTVPAYVPEPEDDEYLE